MALLQVPVIEHEIILNTPNRNEILKEGPPQNSSCNILGRGAYGTVFKAVFKAKQVAVKIVKNLKDINLQSMRNEAHVLGWKHRNIVRILKIESTPNFGIVIMERFAGQCLQIILDSLALPLLHRVLISFDVLSALAYCHHRNLLHLDVKPQNILVAFTSEHPPQYCSQNLQLPNQIRNYVCKLCDFGSSMKLSEGKKNVTRGTTKGTVRYMSPEALRDEPLTPAADIFSLGITMWQLQQRQLPYYWIESNEVVAYQVVKNKIRPDSDAALLSTMNLQNNSDRHRNCLCENFSSEISYRSLQHIKYILNHTENQGAKEATVKLSYRTNADKPNRARVPFRELSPQTHANVPRNLRPEFGLLGCTPPAERRIIDPLLETVFGHVTGMKKISEERNYETVYKLCWHSDHSSRPSSAELRRKLEALL